MIRTVGLNLFFLTWPSLPGFAVILYLYLK
jgi:hypothetical protein